MNHCDNGDVYMQWRISEGESLNKKNGNLNTKLAVYANRFAVLFA